jgi:hypothetical protein
VQNPVRAEILDELLDAIENRYEINITTANVSDLLLLSEEFGMPELTGRCESFPLTQTIISNDHESAGRFDHFSDRDERLDEGALHRIDMLEEQVLSLRTANKNLKSQIEQLCRDCEGLKAYPHEFARNGKSMSMTRTHSDLEQLKPSLQSYVPIRPQAPIRLPTSLSVCASNSLKQIELGPDRGAMGGIISYLERKCGGNVHDNGKVTITSKSTRGDIPGYAVRNIADVNSSNTWFGSKNEPGQWVCLDFHEMRVRATHYAIHAGPLKSWVIESSLDSVNWTHVDRQDEANGKMGTYKVANLVEGRFIRLTQTDMNYYNQNVLEVAVFEVFGTLFE